ncbi:MAG TPA: DNA gyrase inhibitor YacG [Candidatus Nitrosotenuis sp.]|nr:DNA gyrase inhibitor YacG [Candidatus Nitrosotenuis sp.]HIH45657.1 DNA gyrase inhibitor YacG [Candidatus Nitrosotenuis sp.]HIH68998.1 DNA gyrase inhibitor YacG [Candidatus Nitrosotenuis sp.]HII03998.1 DNA gyrase inhibitor YacG [Candidatus Nitrosotenuis sp.]
MANHCKTCGKQFEEMNEEFCSKRCKREYLKTLEKKLDDVFKNDPGHTKRLSKS